MEANQAKVLQLLEQHGRSLHGLLGRLTRCEHASSDLMQELFIKLSCSNGFGKALNPYAYAWKTATNLAFGWRRQQKIKFEQFELESLSDESSSAALQLMIRDEEFDLVLGVTAKFNALARNVIVMRFIEQKSYEQIAERLGKKPNHIRSLCSKTLMRLKDILNKHVSAHTDREVSYE